jgi:hypothetical protein
MVGFVGIGISLVLFVLALRHLGTARTSAYFSLAPFIGAVLAIGLLHEAVSVNIVLASLLMGVGLWLHLAERHEHEHPHEALEHEHSHRHDVHHRHTHDGPVSEPHFALAPPRAAAPLPSALPRPASPARPWLSGYSMPSDCWTGGGMPKLGWKSRRRKPGAKALSGLTETCGSISDPVTR